VGNLSLIKTKLKLQAVPDTGLVHGLTFGLEVPETVLKWANSPARRACPKAPRETTHTDLNVRLHPVSIPEVGTLIVRPIQRCYGNMLAGARTDSEVWFFLVHVSDIDLLLIQKNPA